MISFSRQLKLLLWKAYVIKKKQKVWLSVEIAVPVLLFALLVLIRTRDFNVLSNECHYDAKAFPSAGVLPFLQSLLCSLSNNCRDSPTTADDTYYVNNQTSTNHKKTLLVEFARWTTSLLALIGEQPDKWASLIEGLAQVIHVLAVLNITDTGGPGLTYPFAFFYATPHHMLDSLQSDFGYDNRTASKFLNISVTPRFLVYAFEEDEMSSKSSKMKLLVMCNGYEMRHSKANSFPTIRYWRCLKKFCGGRAKSAFGAEANLEQTKGHKCRLSERNLEKRQRLVSIKQNAISSYSTSSSNIVSNAKRELINKQLLQIPHDSALQRMVQRAREPVGASSVDKLPMEIEWLEFFKNTIQGASRASRKGLHKYLYWVFRQNQPNLPPFYIFLSQSELSLMRRNLDWAIDGTFSYAPNHFYQLYTINVFRGETTLPAAYCHLLDKCCETYVRMFTALRDVGILKPNSVVADFEVAPIKALSMVFGDVLVLYCLFRLCKNAFAHIQLKGLILQLFIIIKCELIKPLWTAQNH